MEFANNTGNTVAEIFVASCGVMNIQNKSAGTMTVGSTSPRTTRMVFTRIA